MRRSALAYPGACAGRYLLQRTGNPVSPAFYILGAGIISVLAALTITETAGRPLQDF